MTSVPSPGAETTRRSVPHGDGDRWDAGEHVSDDALPSRQAKRAEPQQGEAAQREQRSAEPDQAVDYVVIADCGHIPAYEEPDEFRRVVFEWCDAH